LLPTKRDWEANGERSVRQITTGQLVHRPAKASVQTIDGALWLEVDAAIGAHVNYALLETEPIAVDGARYAVKDFRGRPGEGVRFRLTCLAG